LFLAGINPCKAANKITLQEYKLLAKSVKKILHAAIKSKGTTFRNFITHDGNSGTFKTLLKTYGRRGQPCVNCNNKLESIRIGQRSTVYCPQCQNQKDEA
jgi:formamidopyrimidine-DNA glycosylase